MSLTDWDLHSWNMYSVKNPLKPKHKVVQSIQGLLKLLWMVYSEGKLQSCLKLRNFQNPFNKDKSVGL